MVAYAGTKQPLHVARRLLTRHDRPSHRVGGRRAPQDFHAYANSCGGGEAGGGGGEAGDGGEAGGGGVGLREQVGGGDGRRSCRERERFNLSLVDVES